MAMDGALSPSEQQSMVSSFLEIAVGQTADTARQFLQATSWKLEDAVQLFYVGNDGGSAAEPSLHAENDPIISDSFPRVQGIDRENQGALQPDADVRAPLPVKRDVLYDHPITYGPPRQEGSSYPTHSVVPFRNFKEEMKHPRVWGTEQGSSSSADDKVQDGLASLYRPPFALMFQGTFEKAKDNAKMQNKWLLVNVQSTKEFNSHMLNRDTWANEAVEQTIKNNFVFWQIYDDTEEGRKVCTYYKLENIPAVLVIDPITGQKMHSWRGMVQPDNLLEDLVPFMDGSPSNNHIGLSSHKRPRDNPHSTVSHISGEDEATYDEDEELQRALAASMETINNIEKAHDGTNPKEPSEEKEEPEKPSYPPLPEEPKGADRTLLCRVGVRLPDGRRIQRNFNRTDQIQLLWSFCYTELKEEGTKPFRLTQAIPGASKTLDYDKNSTFEKKASQTP